MSVTVSNTGVVVLPIPSITLSSTSPQPYTQTNTCGTSVAVGSSCTINVVFDPAAPGASAATLAINAGTTPSNVSLSGSRDVPDHFDDQRPDCHQRRSGHTDLVESGQCQLHGFGWQQQRRLERRAGSQC